MGRSRNLAYRAGNEGHRNGMALRPFLYLFQHFRKYLPVTRAFTETYHFIFVTVRQHIGDLHGVQNVEVPEKINIGRSDLKYYEIRFQRLPMREKLNPHICQSMAGHAEWNHLWMKIGTLLFEEFFK